MEEAAQAIEKVVLPTMKPIELLPRSAEVLAKQISLVEGSYKFATQVPLFHNHVVLVVILLSFPCALQVYIQHMLLSHPISEPRSFSLFRKRQGYLCI